MNKEDRDYRIKKLIAMEKDLANQRHVLEQERDDEIRKSFTGKCYKIKDSFSYLGTSYSDLIAYKILLVDEYGETSSVLVFKDGIRYSTKFHPWEDIYTSVLGTSSKYRDYSQEITSKEFNAIFNEKMNYIKSLN